MGKDKEQTFMLSFRVCVEGGEGEADGRLALSVAKPTTPADCAQLATDILQRCAPADKARALASIGQVGPTARIGGFLHDTLGIAPHALPQEEAEALVTQALARRIASAAGVEWS